MAFYLCYKTGSVTNVGLHGHLHVLMFLMYWYSLQNGLATKVEKSRKQIKERKNRTKKIRGVKKVSFSHICLIIVPLNALFVQHVTKSVSCVPPFCRPRLERLPRRNENISVFPSVHYQALLCLGWYPCGNVAECLIITRKDSCHHLVFCEAFVVSCAQILRNLSLLSDIPVVTRLV